MYCLLWIMCLCYLNCMQHLSQTHDFPCNFCHLLGRAEHRDPYFPSGANVVKVT